MYLCFYPVYDASDSKLSTGSQDVNLRHASAGYGTDSTSRCLQIGSQSIFHWIPADDAKSLTALLSNLLSPSLTMRTGFPCNQQICSSRNEMTSVLLNISAPIAQATGLQDKSSTANSRYLFPTSVSFKGHEKSKDQVWNNTPNDILPYGVLSSAGFVFWQGSQLLTNFETFGRIFCQQIGLR